MQELLADYPTIVDIPIAWGDMDSLQHVNNIVYFRYFETSRIVCFEHMRLYEERDESGIGPILHSINCRFRIPITYPDTVSVGTRVTELLEDRFTVESCAVSHQHQKVAAQGTGIVVAFDYRTQKKAHWPSALRQNILDLGFPK